jgi:hypothetical protein
MHLKVVQPPMKDFDNETKYFRNISLGLQCVNFNTRRDVKMGKVFVCQLPAPYFERQRSLQPLRHATNRTKMLFIIAVMRATFSYKCETQSLQLASTNDQAHTRAFTPVGTWQLPVGRAFRCLLNRPVDLIMMPTDSNVPEATSLCIC